MLSKAADSILFRIFLIALIVLPILFIIAKGIMKYENWTGFSHITLLGLAANGGLLLVVLGIIFAVIFAKDTAQSTSRLIVFVMFFYCILVYSADRVLFLLFALSCSVYPYRGHFQRNGARPLRRQAHLSRDCGRTYLHNAIRYIPSHSQRRYANGVEHYGRYHGLY